MPAPDTKYIIHNYFRIGSRNGFDLAASTGMIGVRFTAQQTKNVDKILIYITSVTGTSPTYRTGLQGESSGIPDGTWLGPTNNGYKDAQFSAGWNELVLDEDVSLTADTDYFIVVEYNSGTIDGSNYVRVAYSVGGSDSYQPLNKSNSNINFYDSTGTIRTSTNSGSSWALVSNSIGIYLFNFDDATYEGIPHDASADTTESISGANWKSQKISVSGNQTIRAIGFVVGEVGPPNGDLLYEIRDSGETVLRSGTLISASDFSEDWYDVTLSSALSLTGGSTYRFVLKSPDTSSGFYRVEKATTTDSAPYNAETYGGTASCYSESSNSGTDWTDETNGDIRIRLSDTGTYSSESLINSRIKAKKEDEKLLNASVSIPTNSSDKLLNARIELTSSSEKLLTTRIKAKIYSENVLISRVQAKIEAEKPLISRIKILSQFSHKPTLSRIKINFEQNKLLNSRIKTELSSDKSFNARISGLTTSPKLLNAMVKLKSESEKLLTARTIIHGTSDKLVNARIKISLSGEKAIQSRILKAFEQNKLLIARILKSFTSEKLVAARIKKAFSSEKLLISRISKSGSSEKLINAKVTIQRTSEKVFKASVKGTNSSENVFEAFISGIYESSKSINARVFFDPKIMRIEDTTNQTTRSSDEIITKAVGRIGGDRIFPT